MENGGGLKILMVEDNEFHARLLQKMLMKVGELGFEIVHVTRASDAVSQLAKGDTDVVLLDLTLPDSFGIDTVKRIRESAMRVPIVVLTGVDDEGLGETAVQNGAQDYLIKGKVGGPAIIRSINFSINRQRLLNESMERLAIYDSLTDVLNRRGLQEVLTIEAQRAKRNSSELIVMLIDMDNFKGINDTLGHAVGDMVLKEVASRLRNALRPTDRISRVGGDEFVILLPDTRFAEGLEVAERVRMALSGSFFQLGTRQVNVTASVGVTKLSVDASFIIDELLTQTESALQRSKRKGKNRVSYADTAETTGNEDVGVLTTIKELLRKGEGLRAISEPILRLSDEQVVGHELLTRGPKGPFEMPNDFFRLAFESNMLTVVDRHCLQACIAASANLPLTSRIHVNLLPSTLVGISVDHLIEMFAAARGKRTFCVEISEQQTLGDPSYLVEPLSALRRSGVLIAIDDVGFGRSCLESLVTLEPDIVKIDGKYVHAVNESPWRARGLHRLLKVIESLGAEAVAEGIETRSDLEVMKAIGIKYGQGFLWSRAEEPAAKETSVK